MSNPTELPDLDALLAEHSSAVINYAEHGDIGSYYNDLVSAENAIRELVARRAQPEGEAPQAEPIGQVVMYPNYSTVIRWREGVTPPAGTLLYDHAPAAQHAESSAPAVIPNWQQRFKQAHPTSESAYWPDSLKVKYMDAEIDDLRKALAAQSQGAQAKAWEFCPECGSEDSEPPRNGMGHFCLNCGQEWHEDIDYTDAVRMNLARGAVPQHAGSALGQQRAQQAAAPGALARFLNVTAAQPQIDYSVVSAYADKHRLHFNGLCAMVREAAAPSAPGTPEAPGLPGQSDEEAYASSGYRHFMSLDTFKAFRAECANRAAQLDTAPEAPKGGA